MVQKLNLVFRGILLLVCLTCAGLLIRQLISIDENPITGLFASSTYGSFILGTLYAYMRWHIIDTIWKNPENYSEEVKQMALSLFPNLSKIKTIKQNPDEDEQG